MTRRAAWAASLVSAAALLLTACGTTAAVDETASPLPPPVAQPVAQRTDAPPATGEAEAATPVATADAPATTPAEPDPQPAPPPAPATWFPDAAATVRLAGLAMADGARWIETRTVRAGADATRRVVHVAMSSTAADGSMAAFEETYLAEIAADEIRIALAPDAVREVPASVRELPLPPAKGASWRTPTGVCRIEAVDETVETFLGPRPGCVRVAIVSPSGRRTVRWHDPQFGEVRREVRDRSGALEVAWALCGATAPDAARLRALLGQ